MLDALRWLALEAKYLPPVREFYAHTLGLDVVDEDDDEIRLRAGDHELRLRRPSGVPRGGLHTHYALATPDDRYDEWWDRLSGTYDLEEHTFGSARSLYLYDPEGNCVEIGQRGEGDRDVTGIFEIVLEVEDLAEAETFYADLGFETVDRGEDRMRVRMTGPMDLELWEPHLGLADARGGVHVDLGFVAEDPQRAVEPIEDRIDRFVFLADGVRVRDPNGHWLTVREP